MKNEKDFNQQMKKFYNNLFKVSMDEFFPLLENQFKELSHQLNVLAMHFFVLENDKNQFVCKFYQSIINDVSLSPIHQKQFNDQNLKALLNKGMLSYKNLSLFLDSKNHSKVISYLYPLIFNHKLYGFIHFYSDQEKPLDEKMIENEMSNFFDLISLRLSLYNISLEKDKLEIENTSLRDVKDRFIKNISHEIRTPLSGIHNAFYLLEKSNLSNEQKGYFEIGKISLDIMTNVLHDLIDFSNLIQGEVNISNDVFDLEDEVVLLVHQLKQVYHQSHVDIILDFDDQIDFKTIGDYRKIRQILINLLENAIKYTKMGQIKVFVQCKSKTNQKAMIQMDIQDTGIGVDESQLDYISEPLNQADTSDTKHFQGLGLGLSIAQQYAHMIGADIQFKSQKYIGTDATFSLELVIGESIIFNDFKGVNVFFVNQSVSNSNISHQMIQMGGNCYDMSNIKDVKIDIIVFEDVDIKRNEIDHTRRLYGNEKSMMVLCHHGQIANQNSYDFTLSYPISKQGIYKAFKQHLEKFNHQKDEKVYHELLSGHVMIVDDNRLNRLALESVLSKLGMRSALAESGKKALEMIQRDNYDIIFMDVQMPVMDGIETTRKIRHLGKDYEDIPIIAVTANAYFRDYDLLKSAKINDVIFKPIQMDELNLMLRKHLKRKSKINLPDDLSIFDEIDFNVRFEGAMDIAKEVIETFLLEYPKDLDKINKAIMNMDFHEIIETTHYFKGSCSYLSAKKAVWILDEMLNEAKHQKIDQLSMLYQHLEESVHELVVTMIKKNEK